MSAIEEISLKSRITWLVLVQEEDEFVVEQRCIYTPTVELSRHSTLDEARVAANNAAAEKIEFKEKWAAALALIRPKFQAMGVEGALEYYENMRRKMGLPVK